MPIFMPIPLIGPRKGDKNQRAQKNEQSPAVSAKRPLKKKKKTGSRGLGTMRSSVYEFASLCSILDAQMAAKAGSLEITAKGWGDFTCAEEGVTLLAQKLRKQPHTWKKQVLPRLPWFPCVADHP